MKIGKSKHQIFKNQLWRLWYCRSLFWNHFHRKPSNEELNDLYNSWDNINASKFEKTESIMQHLNAHKNLKVELWDDNKQSYRDNNLCYLVNHITGNIFIIDKRNMKFPKKATKDAYTIYKNKFAFQQYIDNKINRKDYPGAKHFVGRACSRYIYVKKIHRVSLPIHKLTKKGFAQMVNTRISNLNLYYDKVRGHKGFWISNFKDSEVFYNHKLPKYGHYTKVN